MERRDLPASASPPADAVTPLRLGSTERGRARAGRTAVLAVGVIGLLTVSALALAMTQGVGQPPTGETDAGLEIAPDFSLPTFTGETFTLSQHEAGPVFLYFWGSWCLPCRDEAPIVERLWPEYRARGYTFVGVNILDTEKAARAFAEEFKLTFPLMRDAEGSVYLQYGVYAVPESFFLTPGLRVQTKYLGDLTEESLRQRLDRIRP